MRDSGNLPGRWDRGPPAGQQRGQGRGQEGPDPTWSTKHLQNRLSGSRAGRPTPSITEPHFSRGQRAAGTEDAMGAGAGRGCGEPPESAASSGAAFPGAGPALPGPVGLGAAVPPHAVAGAAAQGHIPAAAPRGHAGSAFRLAGSHRGGRRLPPSLPRRAAATCQRLPPPPPAVPGSPARCRSRSAAPGSLEPAGLPRGRCRPVAGAFTPSGTREPRGSARSLSSGDY